jgi:hypothetical protein
MAALSGRKRLQIEKAWLGGPSTLKEYHATGTSVHRFKVDEKAGYLITTCRDGGLNVTDLADGQVLWSLSQASRSVRVDACQDIDM